MARIASWVCACGGLAAEITLHRRSTVICDCRFCRAFARWCDRGDLLDKEGGLRLELTVPAQVRVTEGMGHIGAVRFSRNGPIRHLATCCRTPFVNIHPSLGFPYASVSAAGLTDAQDRTVSMRVNGWRMWQGKGSARMVAGILSRAWGTRLRGAHRQSAFFDEGGRPAFPPERPSKEDYDRVLDAKAG